MSPKSSEHHHHHHSSSSSTSSAASSTSSSTASSASAYYHYLPSLDSWVQPTSIIEDEDLTFGGKSLSTWYEEERRRLSLCDEEDERRGRERVRR